MKEMKITLTEENGGAQLVIAAYRPGEYTPSANYMRISADKDWLHIITDDYEGHAMINVEALAAVRRALARIAKARRPAASPGKRAEER